MEFMGWRVEEDGKEVGFWGDEDAAGMLDAVGYLLGSRAEPGGVIRIVPEYVKGESK